jgi:hypothetical protein
MQLATLLPLHGWQERTKHQKLKITSVLESKYRVHNTSTKFLTKELKKMKEGLT